MNALVFILVLQHQIQSDNFEPNDVGGHPVFLEKMPVLLCLGAHNVVVGVGFAKSVKGFFFLRIFCVSGKVVTLFLCSKCHASTALKTYFSSAFGG